MRKLVLIFITPTSSYLVKQNKAGNRRLTMFHIILEFAFKKPLAKCEYLHVSSFVITFWSDLCGMANAKLLFSRVYIVECQSTWCRNVHDISYMATLNQNTSILCNFWLHHWCTWYVQNKECQTPCMHLFNLTPSPAVLHCSEVVGNKLCLICTVSEWSNLVTISPMAQFLLSLFHTFLNRSFVCDSHAYTML